MKKKLIPKGEKGLNSNEIKFRRDEHGYWRYITSEGYENNLIKTNKNYDYGENQEGKPYYIKYKDEYIGRKTFDLYPIEDDLYSFSEKGIDGMLYDRVLPVEWGKYYNNSIWLPNLTVYPKTGTLELYTYHPLEDGYIPGHSVIDIKSNYPKDKWYMPMNDVSVDIDMDYPDYNLIFNNCSDGTRKVLEYLFNKKMNPWFFTTPGDSRDFLLENGGKRTNNLYDSAELVTYKLSEEQLIRLKDFINNYINKKKWKRNGKE